MIVVGDLYQLPPVVTSNEKAIFSELYDSPYFFSSRAFANANFAMLELEKVYRQRDQEFVELLGGIRNRSITDEQLRRLNQRVQPDFVPSDNELYIYLTTTNARANEINRGSLSRLRGESYIYQGKITGNFDLKSLPTTQSLELKIGAQGMLVNNDAEARWINGTIGEIAEVESDPNKAVPDTIVVRIEEGDLVEVQPHTWEMIRIGYDARSRSITSDAIGSFTQYPLMLAWAITIHKSQGKTFPHAIVDLGRGSFAHGQTYVALSRCTALDGLILTTPVKKSHILMDWQVVRFLTGAQYQRSEEALPLKEKIARLERVISCEGRVRMTYLKGNDEKSEREVTPVSIGKMEYKGTAFVGMRAFCDKRQEERTFRVDRIIRMEEI